MTSSNFAFLQQVFQLSFDFVQVIIVGLLLSIMSFRLQVNHRFNLMRRPQTIVFWVFIFIFSLPFSGQYILDVAFWTLLLFQLHSFHCNCCSHLGEIQGNFLTYKRVTFLLAVRWLHFELVILYNYMELKYAVRIQIIQSTSLSKLMFRKRDKYSMDCFLINVRFEHLDLHF